MHGTPPVNELLRKMRLSPHGMANWDNGTRGRSISYSAHTDITERHTSRESKFSRLILPRKLLYHVPYNVLALENTGFALAHDILRLLCHVPKTSYFEPYTSKKKLRAVLP